MRKLLAIILLFAFCLGLAAQTAKDEAIQSLDNAKKYLQSDNFAKAQDEMNYASSKISEIQSEILVKYLPDAPVGFKVEDKNAQGMGGAGAILGSQNAITAVGKYSSGKEDADGNTPEITLTISVGGIMGKASGLAALGQMFSGYGMTSGTGTKTVRVGGYSGTQEFSAGSGKLTVQVGEKVSIIVEGEYLVNPDLMKTLVEKIDLAKLEKEF